MSTFNQSTRTTKKKNSGKKLGLIIVALLVVVAAGAYAYVAQSKGMWPFTAANSASQDGSQSIKITKVEVANAKDLKGKTTDQKVLNVAVSRDAEQDGYCVLTLTNEKKKTSIVLDESKMKQSKDAPKLKNCVSWSVDVSALPKGEYSVEVKLMGSNTPATDKSSFTLK